MIDARKKSIPAIVEAEILLHRKEDDGYIHIRTKSFKNVMLISQLGDYILNFCNGENSVDDIIGLVSTKFPAIPYEKIRDDIDSFLLQIWSRHIITFNNYNYLLDLFFFNFSENDFLFKFMELQESIIINDHIKSLDSYYANPYIIEETYVELSTHWTTKEESWFSISYRQEPVLYLSVRPAYGINIFYICKACIMDDTLLSYDLLCKFFQYIIGIYQQQFSKHFLRDENFTFIQYALSSDRKLHGAFQDIGKLESEICGQAVFVYSLPINVGGN